MSYFQIIRDILKERDKGMNVIEIHKEVKKSVSTCPIERVYIVLGKMHKKGYVIKKREGMYNLYKWVGKEISNKYNTDTKNYGKEIKSESLDNCRELQHKRRPARRSKRI